MKLLNEAPIINDSDIVLFCCVRNEKLRLPYFMDYYKTLGIDRFIFIDNDSDDGTTEYLLSCERTHVFHTKQSYAASGCGLDWLNALLDTYAVGHWALVVDADELFIYPGVENHKLDVLTRYLDSVDAQGVDTFLLDMYSDLPIKDTVYKSGKPFLNICRYFDKDSYIYSTVKRLPMRGGPRHRIFWEGHNQNNGSPALRKVPFVKWRSGLKFLSSTHSIEDVRPAPISGALQHFKFFSDFITYSEEEVNRKEHWDNASEYSSYLRVFKENPEVSAFYEGSVAYQDSNQLIDIGLLRDHIGFKAYRSCNEANA